MHNCGVCGIIVHYECGFGQFHPSWIFLFAPTSRRVGFAGVLLGTRFPGQAFFGHSSIRAVFCRTIVFFATTLGWIRYAVREGMIPVVDMQTWLNQHLEWWEVGRKNAWEFYFEQPCEYSLADIRHAANVVIANGTIAPCNVGLWDVVNSAQLAEELRGLVRKYMRIKHETLVGFNNPEFEDALRRDGKSLIGVRARGTDYCAVRPHGSAVQPEVGDFIRKLSEFPRNSSIYLVSEDKNIIEPMKEAYGDRLIFSKQALPDYRGGLMPTCRIKGYTREREGAGYLKAIYDLSRCPNFIGGCNNGTFAAYLLSKGYDTFHSFDLGTYP